MLSFYFGEMNCSVPTLLTNMPIFGDANSNPSRVVQASSSSVATPPWPKASSFGMTVDFAFTSPSF